ncbi:MAG TPA: DUF4136 domain-containing protein [Gammaproteobacteria bacterium]|nr:DUF4136 domain-containing protein [Gammaproteobacteria bacterium]
MKLLFRSAALLAIAALAACATTPQVEYSHQANFAGYHSFVWTPLKHATPVKNPVLDSEILDQRVRAATVQTLLKHGYSQAPSASQADFLVTYRTASEQQLRSNSGVRFGFGIGRPFWAPYDPYWRAAIYPFPYDIQSYQEGHLIIDIIDAQTQKLVWRGWTSAIVRPDNFSDEAVNEMVNTILSRFPPTPGS